MINKHIIGNNLIELRKNLGYTQADLAEVLGVNTRMIHNYESGNSLLPLTKAFKLTEEFNCSLDWLYGNSTKEFDKCDDFLIDIRNLIYRKNDSIVFSINDSYWEYIKTVNAINDSSKTTFEKQREILKLKAEYKNTSNLAWEYSININEFLQFYKPDSKSSCPYIEESHVKTNISYEQEKSGIDFLNFVLNDIQED